MLVILVLLGVMLIVFGMVFLTPGNPITRLAGNKPISGEHGRIDQSELPPRPAVRCRPARATVHRHDQRHMPREGPLVQTPWIAKELTGWLARSC